MPVMATMFTSTQTISTAVNQNFTTTTTTTTAAATTSTVHDTSTTGFSSVTQIQGLLSL